jgi:hypothetical protein
MIGLVLGAAACTGTPEEPTTGPAAPAPAPQALDTAPAQAPVTLAFAPGDLTSSTFDTPITLFAEGGGQPVDEALLQEIASQIDLRTYPELTPVDVDVHVVPSARPVRPVRSGNDKSSVASEPPEGDSVRARIVLTPRRPLADRWHVVSLAALPRGTRPVAWTGVVDAALGAFAARFHPGSAPVVRDVRLCEKQDGRVARVIATFSEGLRLDPARVEQLVDAQDTLTGELCKVVAPVAPDVPQTTIEIDCPESVLEGRSIDLGLSAALMSMTGAPLTSIEARGRAVGVDGTLDFSEAVSLAGCRTLAVP